MPQFPTGFVSYPIPKQWGDDFHVKRWGFHGASHRYIAERTAELLGSDNLRVISCHLGGSNSLCGIRGRVKSVGNDHGNEPPRAALPHNNRVGDFDPFAIPVIMQATGKTHEEVLSDLANVSGLLGLSGVSGDIRDLEEAAAEGNTDAEGSHWRFSPARSGVTLAVCLWNSAGRTLSSSLAESVRTA